MNFEARTLTNVSSLITPFRLLAIIGLFLLGMGAIVSTERLWAALLWGGIAMLGIGAGAIFSQLFQPVLAETGVADVGAAGLVPLQKSCRAAIGRDHALFHQFLGEQFFVGLDSLNLLLIVELFHGVVVESVLLPPFFLHPQ